MLVVSRHFLLSNVESLCSLVLLSICRATSELLDRCLSAATDMLSAGAFVHQYEAYGLNVGQFRCALAQVEQVRKIRLPDQPVLRVFVMREFRQICKDYSEM